MQSPSKTLQAQLLTMNVRISEAQEAQLRIYLDLLGRWRRAMNLSALKGAELVRRLIVEPLWVAQELRPTGFYLDVGSGNGSPALPWHVFSSFSSAELVEARRRRAVFLQRAARRMGLSAVTVHPARAEDLTPGRIPIDWITVQGVRLTPDLWRHLANLSSERTRLVWITGVREPGMAVEERLEIPRAGRSALVFAIGRRTQSGLGWRDDL